MYKITISAGEIPALYPQMDAAAIRALPDGILELGCRTTIGIKPNSGRLTAVWVGWEVDWELAEQFHVIASDGPVFSGHVRDWDEAHGVLVIELD
jgi:hypothetical protein